MFSDHHEINIEFNNWKITEKFPPIWKLNTTFPWVKEIMGN